MLAVGTGVLCLAVPVAASPDDTVPPDDTLVPADPVPTLAPGELPPANGPLVVVPAGCVVPQQPAVVFEGELVSVSTTAARFQVRRVLAGSLVGRTVAAGIVDVEYSNDRRFLELGRVYVVGAADDQRGGMLRSAVRAPEPLFGGDAVIGIDDSDVQCPRLEDPVRTLWPDGTSVDSGVLTPLDGQGGRLLRAVLLPLGVAFAVLVALVLFKLTLFAVGRSLRDLATGPVEPRPVRGRRHRPSA